MSDYIIRDAELEDASRLVEIYSYYVEDTAISFEYEVPSVEEFANRINRIKAKYPYLVCVDGDKIVGICICG